MAKGEAAPTASAPAWACEDATVKGTNPASAKPESRIARQAKPSTLPIARFFRTSTFILSVATDVLSEDTTPASARNQPGERFIYFRLTEASLRSRMICSLEAAPDLVTNCQGVTK